jgi:hypothetical protein
MSAVIAGPGRMVASRLRVSPPRPNMTRLVAADGDSVTLASTSDTRHRGRFGLVWPGGHAVVGEVLAMDGRGVTRRLLVVDGVPPVGEPVRWNKFVYPGEPGFGEAVVDGPLGPLPAWSVPGRRSTCVVMVHGNRATRAEALRILPTVHGLGYPVLVSTYRNDPEAPRSPDGLYHLGDTEWVDLEAAVDHALRAGARDVVLYGWSMGGSIVETFLHRSASAARVRAVVLDAPILNPDAVTDAQLRRLHVPAWAGGVLNGWWRATPGSTSPRWTTRTGRAPGRGRHCSSTATPTRSCLCDAATPSPRRIRSRSATSACRNVDTRSRGTPTRTPTRPRSVRSLIGDQPRRWIAARGMAAQSGRLWCS